jgi:hypothetical protein
VAKRIEAPKPPWVRSQEEGNAMTREQKFDAVYDLAKLLVAQGRTNTFDDLGAWLNRQGFTTGYGTALKGGRGVARVVWAAYRYVRNELGLGDAGAAPIAEAFTDASGDYAYE